MMKASVQWLVLALAALIMTACQSSSDHASSTASAAPRELKLYSVPAEQTDAIHQSLGTALGPKASISKAAPGRLLIYASRDTQASISHAIEAMEKATPAAVKAVGNRSEPPLQVRFWVIDALAGSGDDDPALKTLVPTLNSLRQSLGPLHFSLYASASAASTLGQSGVIQTGESAATQQFKFSLQPASDGEVQLHLDYFAQGPQGIAAMRSQGDAVGLAQLTTQLTLKTGQFIVLGNGPGGCAASSNEQSPCAQKPLLRLLVVRVDRLTP